MFEVPKGADLFCCLLHKVFTKVGDLTYMRTKGLRMSPKYNLEHSRFFRKSLYKNATNV